MLNVVRPQYDTIQQEFFKSIQFKLLEVDGFAVVCPCRIDGALNSSFRIHDFLFFSREGLELALNVTIQLLTVVIKGMVVFALIHLWFRRSKNLHLIVLFLVDNGLVAPALLQVLHLLLHFLKLLESGRTFHDAIVCGAKQRCFAVVIGRAEPEWEQRKGLSSSHSVWLVALISLVNCKAV